MSYEPNNISPVPSPEAATSQARRRAILAGLGKGSVALAALSPLASEASRTHKLFNAVLGKDCYCSVSGFQSPVVAGSSPTTCFTYTPGTFVKKTAIMQNFLTFSNANSGGAPDSSTSSPGFIANFTNALNNYFVLGGAQRITNAQAQLFFDGSTVYASQASVLLLSNGGKLTFSAYQAKNFPPTGTGSDPSVSFNSIFPTSADTRSLLEVLYDGVASSSPASAKCYYLSSYLSMNNGLLSPSLPVGLDRPYVVVEYSNDANAASATDVAAQFFKALASRVGP